MEKDKGRIEPVRAQYRRKCTAFSGKAREDLCGAWRSERISTANREHQGWAVDSVHVHQDYAVRRSSCSAEE
jgi:hypothetical protein